MKLFASNFFILESVADFESLMDFDIFVREVLASLLSSERIFRKWLVKASASTTSLATAKTETNVPIHMPPRFVTKSPVMYQAAI